MSSQITTFLAIYKFYGFCRPLQLASVIKLWQNINENKTTRKQTETNAKVKKSFLFPNVTTLNYFRPIIDTANTNLKSFKLWS